MVRCRVEVGKLQVRFVGPKGSETRFGRWGQGEPNLLHSVQREYAIHGGLVPVVLIASPEIGQGGLGLSLLGELLAVCAI